MNTRHRMERRINLRKPVRLRAAVRYRDRGENCRLETTTLNLSFEGAFLETGEIAHLVGSIVRLELQAFPGNPLTIDALVVYRNHAGLGLMFAYYKNEVFEQLVTLLESTPNKSDGWAASGPDTPGAIAAATGEAEPERTAV